MDQVLLIAGIVITLITFFEVIYTTLAPNGAGIITQRASSLLWFLFLLLSGRTGKKQVLNLAGFSITIAVLFIWIVLIWVGTILIFCSDADSVVNGITGLPATTWEKIYYTGYTISSLGNGEFIPNGKYWQIYAACISMTGLMMITIAITYLVPILSAEITKRQLSIYIASLGANPQDIIINGWNGQNFERLEKHFNRLSLMIMKHGQNHLAYPILHYFHNTDKKACAAIQLVNLDEALTILLLYVPEKYRASNEDINPVRKAITSFLITLRSAFITAAEKSPEPPELDQLSEAGIKLKNNGSQEKQLNFLSERRKLLLGLMLSDGWEWRDRNTEPFGDDLTF